ncbi:MAG: SPOR domain-containing protein [Maricaulaceae bacterium]
MVHSDTDGYNETGYGAEDPLIPFDVRDQSGRRGMMILAGAIVALLILATVLFLTYQPGTRDRTDPPRIKAENAPFKVEPENPGGAETPNQDKSVYDVMAGNKVDEKVVTTPGAETPIKMPKSANIVVEKPEPAAPKVATPKPAASTPAPKPVAVASGGEHVVQIASLRSHEAAIDLWDELSTKHGAVIPRGLYSDIVKVDLGSKGIYHRLRVDGLANKAAALRLCDRLKARGQDCIVTSR